MRVVVNGVWGHAYGGACDDRCVSGGSVCVSSVGVATMCRVHGGSIGGLELFGPIGGLEAFVSGAGGWRGRACIPYISWCRRGLSGGHGCDLGLAM